MLQDLNDWYFINKDTEMKHCVHIHKSKNKIRIYLIVSGSLNGISDYNGTKH